MTKNALKNATAKLILGACVVSALNSSPVHAQGQLLVEFRDTYREGDETFSRYYSIAREYLDVGDFPEDGRYRITNLRRMDYTEMTMAASGEEKIWRYDEHQTWEVDCQLPRGRLLRNVTYKDWTFSTIETHGTRDRWSTFASAAPDSTVANIWRYTCGKVPREERYDAYQWGQISRHFEIGSTDAPAVKIAARDPANKLKPDALRLMYP